MAHLGLMPADWPRAFPKEAKPISRRDNRTQPGVLAPGADFIKRLALKGQKTSVGDPRLASGLTNGSVKLSVPYRPFRTPNLGLKPQADSLSPFGTAFTLEARGLATSNTSSLHIFPLFRVYPVI